MLIILRIVYLLFMAIYSDPVMFLCGYFVNS